MKNSIYYTFRSFIRELVRGHIFRYYFYNQIKKNEFSEKNLKHYQYTRLQKILKALGINKEYQKVENEDVVSNFPIISKVDIKRNSSKYHSKVYGKFITNYNRTSGTTGSPLEIKQSLECVLLEEAFVYRQMKWAGYSLYDKMAWIRGDMIVAAETKKSPYWCRDYFMNKLMMSSYHISGSTSELYIRELEKFNPVIIQAYPSSVASLAKWLEGQNKIYNGKSLKSIIVSSEMLEDTTKKIIEKRFNCKVFDWYGQAERVAAIGTCEQGSKHLLTDYSYVEVSGYDKQEIIGTSYNNVAMPFIRYATGDYIKLSKDTCSCGRIFPVVEKIYGRVNNLITMVDGREIAFLDHIFKKTKNIIESQIVYKKTEKFTINIVPGESYDEEDEEHIIKNMKERLGDIEVEVNICEHIPRGANGKFEFVKVEND